MSTTETGAEKLEVIEWPAKGSARRFPSGGGWWVISERIEGWTPLRGPFRKKAEADAALSEIENKKENANG